MTLDSTLILQKAYVAGEARAEREGETGTTEWLKELADSQQHISRGVVVVRLKKGKTFPGQTSKVLVWLRQQTAEWKRGRGVSTGRKWSTP